MIHRRVLAIALFVALTAGLGCEPDDAEPDEPADQVEQADEEETEPADEAPDEEETDEDEEVADEEAALDLPNMADPEGEVITSAQPSEEEFQQLADHGIELVVNLREEDEEGFWEASELAEDLGIEYVRIPVNPEDGWTEENAGKLDEALADRDGDALVHCKTGGRPGGLLALRSAWKLGEDADEALAYGESAGLDAFRDEVAEALEQ